MSKDTFSSFTCKIRIKAKNIIISALWSCQPRNYPYQFWIHFLKAYTHFRARLPDLPLTWNNIGTSDHSNYGRVSDPDSYCGRHRRFSWSDSRRSFTGSLSQFGRLEVIIATFPCRLRPSGRENQSGITTFYIII